MTSESTGSAETLYADTKKQYYHLFDDGDMQKMKHYFKLEEESDHHDVLLRYLRQRRVRTDIPLDNI